MSLVFSVAAYLAGMMSLAGAFLLVFQAAHAPWHTWENMGLLFLAAIAASYLSHVFEGT